MVVYQEDLSFERTKEALGLLGLNIEEIDTYFRITGRGTVTKGEICILKDIPFEQVDVIVKNLLDKGLIREVPGKTPHYLALPPYSALLTQISQFKSLIKNLQIDTPKELENKFTIFENKSMKIKKLEDYQKYLATLKDELPIRIKKQLGSLQMGLEQVKRLHEFNQFINEIKGRVASELNVEFENFKVRLDDIKVKISSIFEKQLRISALKEFIEEIISRILSKEFGFIQEFFEKNFVKKIDETLDQILKRILTVSDTADEISFSVKDTFDGISDNLQVALRDTESKLSEVHGDILDAFDGLKNVFKGEIFDTLQSGILNRIFKQLELSEETMQEFWDRAKKASLLSFQDVWFIRSEEAMRAQINDSITRAKMRLYIIAPKLKDIDIQPLTALPKHINVRISTSIDPSSEGELYESITKFPNINIRNYSRENIWAINRDYEEVVVCVISHSAERDTYEIAGMGSILEEHIKMFAGVLEEVWMQSEKITSLESLKIPQYSSKRIQDVQSIKIKEPIPPEKKVEPSFIKSTSIPKTEPKETFKPIETSAKSHLKQKKQEKTSKPVIPDKIPPYQQKTSLKKQTETKTVKKELKSTSDLNYYIDESFDQIKTLIDTDTGTIISNKLEEIRETLLEKIGASLVIHAISNWVRNLKKIEGNLPNSMKQALLFEIRNWVDKLKKKKS